MKNIKIRKLSFVLLFSTSLLSGCDSFLNQEPQDKVSETVFYKTPEHFEQAANYLYTRLGFDFRTVQEEDASSDLSNNISADYPYGRGLTQIPTTHDIWKKNYINLRAVNQLLEKAVEYTGNPSEIAASVSTAHFFRAWHHFLLLKRYGGVPIVTKSLDVNSGMLYAKRNSRYEVVYQILSDLDKAIVGLPTANDLGLADQGKLSLEAAKSFKARVLLYEATWEKYVGTTTDGDGESEGAGTAKPEGYPSVTDMFTEAKQKALEVMNCPAFELWDHRDKLGERNYFYLFVLEDAASNPAGLTKADNKEFIFQTVYDYTLRKINQNISHARPVCPSRKMMDMYLCTDGLPVQYSTVFKGYEKMTSEFENRDNRLLSFVQIPLEKYWGYGSAKDGGGARYNIGFEGAEAITNYDYRYIPILATTAGGRNAGYRGCKFVTEHIGRETKMESMNYPQIRLAEVMLIYAEAVCELGNGEISDDDLNISINKIRERANVAPLTNELIAPFSELNMLGEIRRERAIELEGEGFRFDDIKRWGIAEEELNHNICLNYITGTEYETAINPKDEKPIYVASAWATNGLTKMEESVSSYAGIAKTKAGALILDPVGLRQFTRKNYVDAIPSDEIKLNSNLLQNPEW